MPNNYGLQIYKVKIYLQSFKQVKNYLSQTDLRINFFFQSEVSGNHLKKASGEIWPKRSEKKQQEKKLPRWGQKSLQ